LGESPPPSYTFLNYPIGVYIDNQEVVKIKKHPLYQKVEELLKDYNSMQARVKNLQLDIERLDKPIQHESIEDTIEGLYYTKALTSGPPPVGTVGDRTASVALAFRCENAETNHDTAWMQIQEKAAAEGELDALQCLIAKIDNAIASLDELQRRIIIAFYIEKKNWIQITNEVNYRERNCRNIKDSAINYMAKSLYGFKKRVSA
jgi:predicted DNA-binding protein (MmcQ/YjbR family)